MPAYSGIWTLSQVNQAIKNLDWTGVPPTVVEYLIVAGGGGGGNNSGGAGGAGGLLQGFAPITLGTSYTVTVGTGGPGGTSTNGTVGVNSVFGNITAFGGGYGGGNNTTGGNGGTGGGGGAAPAGSAGAITIGGAGTSGQGNAGGQGLGGGSGGQAGGGGGAGTVGLNAVIINIAANGGAGIASDITGIRTTYSGGGGGGTYPNTSTPGTGGIGGGGAGASIAAAAGIAGTPNTGGGGGGGAGGSGNGGAGGSGIVVIRYPGNVQYFTGGTLNYSNGYIVHTFYSSGTLAPVAPKLFASPDYQISRSLRFNSASSTYLNRTPTAAGNRKTWTWSGWVKRSKLSSGNAIFATVNATAFNYFSFGTSTGDQLQFAYFDGSTDIFNLNTNATSVYRDVSSWYHVVLSVDTTQTTAANRVLIYVNGVLQTISGTYPTQNYDTPINNNISTIIGGGTGSYTSYLSNQYITEVNFIDGQALTPASFGYVEPTTGVWTPLQYVGTYGTNGFYLNFADNSGITATTLGKDLSGNSNNWTPNNFSVAAGSGNSSLVDTPTNYGVDAGLGGEVRGNYCTLNPLNTYTTNITLSNGNLEFTQSASNGLTIATIGASSGKWYWEYKLGATNYCVIGMYQSGSLSMTYLGQTGVTLSVTNGTSLNQSGVSAPTGTMPAFTSSDVVGYALDMDAGTLIVYLNNVARLTYTGLTGTWFPAQGANAAASGIFNFGQRPFVYTAPTGFKALCTQNLPESGVGKLTSKHFNVVLWTGNGVNPRSVGGVGFQPDLSWHGRRDVGYGSWMFDSVRGATKRLQVSDNTVESTYTELNSFDADGFTQTGGNDQGNNIINALYFAWNWKAGGTAVTNTAGSITSQVSANTQAGFSVVTYTGNNTTGTIGHGLGATPSLIIVRRRETAANWVVYSSVTGATQYLYLNSTAAAAAWAGFWGNTAPTSSVFTVSNDGATNASAGTYVAYCWAEVPGFSKLGSYVGNGSTTGPFIYCGFRPRFVLIKIASGATYSVDNWFIFDTARGTYNDNNPYLLANTTGAEAAFTAPEILSNGFYLNTSSNALNYSGSTYIFAAFAESPFKYARAR